MEPVEGAIAPSTGLCCNSFFTLQGCFRVALWVKDIHCAGSEGDRSLLKFRVYFASASVQTSVPSRLAGCRNKNLRRPLRESNR
ncbi:MAG: hypothetical protein KME20_19400 [Kaiparowitsia implicata GSE-PSE-MK54-09C]|nr:hypothetical protein [Kaiparowitsia implicata GSE-PSE-MK54-09C]